MAMESVPAHPDPTPRWPERLAEVLLGMQAAAAGPRREALRAEAWLLTHTALLRYVRRHAARHGGAPREDCEDVASEKTLDLLARAESGTWTVLGRSPGEIASWLSHVARNGLLDRWRREGRLVHADDDDTETSVFERPRPGADATPDAPDRPAESREFAEHLSGCLDTLPERSQRVWFLRALLELPSADIAAHPAVRLKRGHVDVLLQRARAALRACMQAKGHALDTVPPGAFVALWRRLGRHAAVQEGTHDHG